MTNANLVTKAAAQRTCNAVLIRVNQAGTVTESITTFIAAQQAQWGAVVFARSGETADVSISHLAVGLGS